MYVTQLYYRGDLVKVPPDKVVFRVTRVYAFKVEVVRHGYYFTFPSHWVRPA